MAASSRREGGADDDVGLLAHLIHDLKNPLGVVIGYAEAMSLSEPDEQPELRTRLMVNARAMLEVLDEYSLLDALRQDRVELDRSACNWNGLAERVLKDIIGPAAEREQHVSWRADETVTLYVDAQRVHQVLRILVREALRSTPRGARLELIAQPVEGGVELLVEVSADGVADAPPVLQIFDPERPGMELVRRVVALHGGALSFDAASAKACARARIPLGPAAPRRPSRSRRAGE